MESGGSFESTMARSGVNGEGSAASENNKPAFAKSSIARIMRRALPAGMKLSEDSKEMMQVSVTEFIKLVTNEANERCQSECRSTITVEDVLSAMAALGFDDYIEPLCQFINKYRVQHPGRNGPRGVHKPPPPPPAYYAADREESFSGAQFK